MKVAMDSEVLKMVIFTFIINSKVWKSFGDLRSSQIQTEVLLFLGNVLNFLVLYGVN